jgi:hypothetical protein
MKVEYRTEVHSSLERGKETWWAQIKVIKWWLGIIPITRIIPVDLYLSPKDTNGRPKFPGGKLYGGPMGHTYLGSAYDCKEDVEAAIEKQIPLVKSGYYDLKYQSYEHTIREA